MLIAGLDLAAEPKGSALAIIDFGATSARLEELQLGVDDDAVIDAAAVVDKLGIDCALGWPIEFVQFLQQQIDVTSKPQVFDGGIELRRTLAYRETDRAIAALTGRWPLSVSTDRLGMTAIRCAGLLSKLASRNHNVSRAGEGLVVEVYPAASMRIWGFEIAGYRKSPDSRRSLIAALGSAAPWLDLSRHVQLMVESCDAFDSVIAALATRASAIGASTAPAVENLERAKIEGWMHLPTTDLHALAPHPL